MPPVTKKIGPARIGAAASNAKSRAGDAEAMRLAAARKKRDALMAARATPESKAKMAAADESRKADTFTNNVAASGVVSKAEETRKAALFDSQYAAQKKPKATPVVARKPVVAAVTPTRRSGPRAPSRAVAGVLARARK